MITIRKVTRKECEPFVIGIHYAKRWPSISYAFGLFDDDKLVGVCTFGTPASAPLRAGIAGKEMAKHVLELNRLCLLRNLKNEASMLVAASLRMLPPSIVVSFADTEQGHLGIVYQAANFGYYGLSAKRTDWKIRGLEHLHGQTIADKFRGEKNRAKAIREAYGEDFYLKDRPRKHRYIYVTGSKTFRKDAMSRIRYQKQPYPKAAQ